MSNTARSAENDGMETAIELPLPVGPPRRRQERNRVVGRIEFWSLMVTSETALGLYILIHWLLGCATHIIISGEGKNSKSDDNASFFSFVYFMSTLVAFLSIMSHVSGLLIPLFSFCVSGALFLFFLVNLSLLDTPKAQIIFHNMCLNTNITEVYYNETIQHPTATLIKSCILIVFFILTSIAILFQFARNDEYHRRPPPLFQPGFYPYMLPREIPVGAMNLDEPPRYSTLEPMSSPKQSSTVTHSSTVTSPPRYSYWERTFGSRRARNDSQCSNREMMTAKSH